jgi:transcriptional regulator with XRE-family HTH domain
VPGPRLGHDLGMTAHREPGVPSNVAPDVGGVLRRLRKQYGMSLKELASRSGLSPSFLGAVERGDSDIAVQRLARVAAVFNHDVGSLLGYSVQQMAPKMVASGDRFRIDRGEGVSYEAIRIADAGFELFVASFEPHTRFAGAITHAGIDIVFVVDGEVVLEYSHGDHPLPTGACVSYPGSYPHALRNDSDRPARIVAVTTATVY